MKAEVGKRLKQEVVAGFCEKLLRSQVTRGQKVKRLLMQ